MWKMKDLDFNYTLKMMKMMERIRKKDLSNSRLESKNKYVREIGEKPSYNKKLMNQKLSPTSKSPVRPFKRINENRTTDKWDIFNILNELDND